MRLILRDLRTALSHELAMGGPFVPIAEVGAPPPVSPVRAPEPASPSARLSAPPAEPPRPPALSPPAAPPDTMPSSDLFGKSIAPSEDPSLSTYDRIQTLIPEGSPLRAMTTLAEVEAYANDTILIPLDEKRLNAVFGTGNPTADLMVIGEAPGADEDRKGEPFVGRAGQLLNKILEAINFQREDIYITNILKSRPPNNRDPLPEEVAAHMPLLYKQIAVIQPKVLLAVGKTAGNSLLGRSSTLGSLRGKFHDFHGLPLMVTYHPAALLRNAQWKRPTWEDVKLLRTRYDQLVG